MFSLHFFLFLLLFLFFFFSRVLKICFFWGAFNCFTISCNSSLDKIIFLSRLESTPCEASIPFFSLFTFYSFFDYLNFFCCFFFLDKMCFSVFFFSPKFVPLLAFVFEFNKEMFAPWSVEMWCLDDVGRDSWDWVGPPAWERA